MGLAGQLRWFFRDARTGLTKPDARRSSVQIPDEWQVDYILGRLVTGRICTLADLNAWVYDWPEIWQMHDMMDLADWLDWQQHSEAAKNVNR